MGRTLYSNRRQQRTEFITHATSQGPQMNERTIKIGGYTDKEPLKLYILQKLKLVDHKRDYVNEFYERLKNYIDRNKNLKITFQFDRDKLEKDLKFKLSLTRFQKPYPDNYEMGNPHNRWLDDLIIMTEEEVKQEKLDFERNYRERLLTFNQFLGRLEQIGKGQILIKES